MSSAIFVLLLVGAPAGVADDLSVAPHVALSAGLLTSAAMLAWVTPSLLPETPRCRQGPQGICERSRLPSWDRGAIDADSASWRKVSDVGEVVGIGGPAVALLGLAMWSGQAPEAAIQKPLLDVLVWSETMAVCAFLNQLMKVTLQRPRPVNYRLRTASPTAQLSFPSGHAFATATGTTALTTLVWQRYPSSGARWLTLSTGAAVTLITGVGRIYGGRHFLTDVLAGWILGGALGYVQPSLMLHAVTLTVGDASTAAPGGATMLTLQAAF